MKKFFNRIGNFFRGLFNGKKEQPVEETPVKATKTTKKSK